MVTYTNPWENPGNKAIDAMFKYAMTRPNPAQMQRQDLENRALQSRIDLSEAQANKARQETQFGERRLGSTGQFADLFRQMNAPTTEAEVRPSQSFVGPVITGQRPSDEIREDRFYSGIGGDTMEAAANFAIENPSAIANVMKAFYGGVGAPTSAIQPLMTASAGKDTRSAPQKNFEFFKAQFPDQLRGMSPEAQANMFNSYVRANQKLDLEDRQVLASGATGAPIEQYGTGIAPERDISTTTGQIITAPAVSSTLRPDASQPLTQPTNDQTSPIQTQGDDTFSFKYPGLAQQAEQTGVSIENLPPPRKVVEAQANFTTTLTDIADLYKELYSNQGLVTGDNTRAQNILARLGRSDLGALLGGGVGNKNAIIQQVIDSKRPMLINFIRQASEMGARGLDSEKELEFYLKSATDPRNAYETNMATIAALDRTYGLSKPDVTDINTLNELRAAFQRTMDTAPDNIQQQSDILSPQEEQELQRLRAKYGRTSQ